MHPGLKYELVHERRKLLLDAKSREHAIKTMTYDATQAKKKTGAIMSIRSGQKIPYSTFKQARQSVKKMLSLFPEAKVIHIVRDPMGAINSQVKTFGHKPANCVNDYFDSVPVVSKWLPTVTDPYVVDYSKLIEDPINQASDIYAWMGQEVDRSYIEKALTSRDPWEHEGRIMCGLRYFDDIKPTESKVVLTKGIRNIIRERQQQLS
tara:strand:- start:16302 stop:16922 length:621 start_codon:yes stop_codon:yes gene_type:complete